MFNRLKLSTLLESSPVEEELVAKGWYRIDHSETIPNAAPFESSGRRLVTWKLPRRKSGDDTWPELVWIRPWGWLTLEYALGYNPRSEREALQEMMRLKDYAEECSGVPSSELPDWNVKRISYFTRYEMEADLAAGVMRALEPVYLGHHEKVVCPGGHRICWKTEQNAVCFERVGSSLLFEAEVGDTQYLANEVMEHDRTVNALVTERAALSTLCYYLERLGIQSDNPWVGEREFVARLREEFGPRGWASAHSFSSVVRMHGPDAYRLGYCSKTTYYRQLARLREAGLLWGLGLPVPGE